MAAKFQMSLIPNETTVSFMWINKEVSFAIETKMGGEQGQFQTVSKTKMCKMQIGESAKIVLCKKWNSC